MTASFRVPPRACERWGNGARVGESADAPGGGYREGASAGDLGQVYEDLGSQFGYPTERREVSYWFVRGGVLFALLGVSLSLLWTNRLL